MGKLFLALLVGLVGAAVVHIAVIFTMPRVAEDNAWGRLSRLADLYAPVEVPPAAPTDLRHAGFSFVDPAFVTRACRFSIAEAPVRLYAQDNTAFWSASIYSRNGDNLYSTNRRVAPGGSFDLLVATAEQIETLRIEGLFPSEETVPVPVAVDELYLTLRAIVGDESERPFVERFMESLRCEQLPLLQAGT